MNPYLRFIVGEIMKEERGIKADYFRWHRKSLLKFSSISNSIIVEKYYRAVKYINQTDARFHIFLFRSAKIIWLASIHAYNLKKPTDKG